MNEELEIEPMLANRRKIVTSKNSDKISTNNNEENVLIETEDCPQSSLELIWNNKYIGDIAWSIQNIVQQNVCFTVNEREIKSLSGIPYKFVNKKKIILENQCGRFTSGKLSGVLGPNGAGKTTLLECLGGLRKEGFSGKVFIKNNG